eukprot:364444-Chlamydomonas_euryale.AAC.1
MDRHRCSCQSSHQAEAKQVIGQGVETMLLLQSWAPCNGWAVDAWPAAPAAFVPFAAAAAAVAVSSSGTLGCYDFCNPESTHALAMVSVVLGVVDPFDEHFKATHIHTDHRLCDWVGRQLVCPNLRARGRRGSESERVGLSCLSVQWQCLAAATVNAAMLWCWRWR